MLPFAYRLKLFKKYVRKTITSGVYYGKIEIRKSHKRSGIKRRVTDISFY